MPGGEADEIGPFYLVGSNALPSDRSDFRNSLQEGETFETDFIGASLEDCQAWAQEAQRQVRFIEYDLIAIMDARSAQDKTVLMSHYVPPDPGTPIRFPPFGVLPRERDTWYNYRVEFSYAPFLQVAFYFSPKELFYPAYFGRKEDFTDERGVFNVAEAELFSDEYREDDYWVDPARL
ncbi:uncharacterized protein BHQ10_009014 [Talaromyces amestolkiae]|uniref:Uncharacterized protein n=1 Tax=Talaromyces amestolkiae TaxID=1196081 RepID=A0A364LB23_TALAM|nr:uncharacterized protein BHQ10_009014 [Talaromyces amestolkiae]RAO73002.1 hypothetical protein BHQ10_009014 [Talaromyces amestolkiae]